MKVLTTVAEMKAASRKFRVEGRKIGFVPTMGSIHEGHLSLVREALSKTDMTVVSIFINPTQFGPQEDYRSYPRDFQRDSELLEKAGVPILFTPTVEDIYAPGFKTFVEVQELQDRLCGRSRPGHFRGVATVVLKLFNIIKPDIAFFGWKDAQQLIILKKMAEDLNLDVRIEGLPLVRDVDGLALSSRNNYLTAKERRAALVLTKSLQEARMMADAGERDAGIIIRRIRDSIERESLAKIDYVEIVEEKELLPLKKINGEVLVAIAVFIGKTRLIDNIRIQI